uniref:CAP-Gly domain-containing linker protein 1-like isoform X2 n=1 Tax=Rhizophora mucronata TaxID=61149 RepID=A0A2P2KLD0_RHIMU
MIMCTKKFSMLFFTGNKFSMLQVKNYINFIIWKS